MVSKFRAFSLVIEVYDKLNNKNICDKDLLNYLKDNQDLFVYWCLIKHDKDKDTEGNIVREHYHLVIKLNNNYCKTTIIKDIAKNLLINNLCISCSGCKSLVKSVQYLVHQNDKDKFQYDIFDLYSSDYNETMFILNNSVSSYDLDIDYLVDLIRRSKSLTAVYLELGMKNAKLYRSLIIDIWKEEKLYW